MDCRIVSRLLCVCALIVSLASLAGAQDKINTVAGGGPNQLPATASAIGNPWSVTQFTDGNGTHTYISDNFSNRVFEVTGSTLSVVAGNIVGTFGGRTADSFPATEATLNGPQQVAADAGGNLYIADTNNQAIRFVNMTAAAITFYGGTAGALVVNPGTIQTIVGVDGVPCSASPCGDNGLADAITTNLKSPGGVALDSSGNIYIADTGDNVIRVVNTQAAAITPVTGGPTIQPGNIATILGNYQPCGAPCGDGGVGTPQVNLPGGLWLDTSNNIYIADTNDQVIRLLTAGGTLSRIAGNYSQTCNDNPSNCGDGAQAQGTNVFLDNPTGVAVDSSGNIYIADTADQVVRKVNVTNGVIGVINPFAGNYTQCSQTCGDGGPAIAANLNAPTGLFVDGSGNVFIADQGDNSVREVAASSGNIQTVYGTLLNPEYSGDANPPSVPGKPLNASLYSPTGVIEDHAGNIYIADQLNNRVRKITAASGTISNFAGNGITCTGANNTCGENGAATSAELSAPTDVAVDKSGNVYIADTQNDLIRVVNTQAVSINFYGTNGVNIAPGDILGVVSGVTIPLGYNGDGKPATQSRVFFPRGVALDASGNIYLADSGNDIVRVANTQSQAIKVAGVTIQPGALNIIAGTAPTGTNNPVPCPLSTDPCGDGGPATAAMLNDPTGVAIDRSGNIYIADNNDNRIRVVNSKGVISTIAGNGHPCPRSCGDGGPATQATLSNPNRVFADYNGTIYIADTNDYQVRVVNPGANSITVNGIVISPGEINTAVGSGSHGFTGDGGPATTAELAAPSGLAADSAGDLLITDSTAYRVRSVGRLVVSAPTASLSPNPLPFPSTIVNDTSPVKLTLTNNGNGTSLTVSSITIGGANAADFKETNNCSTVAADGGSCTVTVSFSPSAAGARTATLSVNDNAPGSPQVVTLSGMGVVGLQISPTTQSVSAGSSANYTITVPSQGFSGSMKLSCTTGLPTGAACSFAPNPVAAGKSSTLTISTTANSAALIAPAGKRPSAPLYAIWLLLPAMLLGTAGMTAPKRRKLISYFLLTLAITGALVLVSCGGGGSSGGGGGGGGTPAGSYTVTVQGVAGSTTATQQVTLTVQ